MIKVVAGGDFTSRAIDVEEDGGDRVVVGGLADLEDEIIHHAGADLPGNFLGNDAKEVDFGDTFFLRFISLDKLLIEVGGGVDMGGVVEELMIFGKEEEIGEQAGCEQNESNDEKEFGVASHEKEKDASDRGAGQGGVGRFGRGDRTG